MYVNKKYNRINILLVAHRFYKDSKAGTETLVEDVAIELNKKGYSVYIMAASNDIFEKKVKITNRKDGISCISIPYFPQKNIIDNWENFENTQKKRIYKAMKKLSINFQIVHIFHFARIGLEFFTLPFFKNSKLFVTLTDYSIFCPDYQMFNRKFECICNNINNENSCVECLENVNTAINIKKWKKRNVNFINNYAQLVYTQTLTQRLYVLQSGISGNILHNSTAAYKIPSEWSRLNCKDIDHYMFGFFGRISPEKGLHIFLKAYLKCATNDSKLLICGSMDENEDYNTLITQLIKQSKNIVYSPPVPLLDLGRLISSVNYLVLPSIWNENHSILMTYACALDVQVICSSVPSLKELNYSQITFIDDYNNINSWKKIIQNIQDRKNISNDNNTSRSFWAIQKEFYNLMDIIENNYLSCLNGEQ